MKPRLKQVGCGILAVVGAVAAYNLWIYSRTQWIPAGSVGLIYDAGSGLQKEVYTPRAITVGWRQKLYTYPTQLQAAIYTQDLDEGEMKTADGIQVTTSDNANTTFDVTVIYRVKKDDVVTVFNNFGPIPIEDIQTLHIRRAVKDAVNDISTRYEVFQLMGEKREEVSRLATEGLRQRLASKGITIQNVMLGSCFPSPELQQKINSRVNSYTQLEISRLQREVAEIERQSSIVKAGAEAQARQLSAAKTEQRSLEMLKLQAAEDAIKRWNGSLPTVESKPGQTIIIGRDLLGQEAGR
jgi:regulator of protease activity HflC (stomatin/prohibitin superfamily)